MASPDTSKLFPGHSESDEIKALSDVYDRLSTPLAILDSELHLQFGNAALRRLSGNDLPIQLHGFLADPYGMSQFIPQITRSENFVLRGVTLLSPFRNFEIHIHQLRRRKSLFILELQPRRDEPVSFESKGDEITGQRVRGQLGRLQEEITKANLELQQFAYVASHDLQAPVRGIEGFLKLLLRTAEGELSDASRELVGNALNNSRHMQRLIQDLLGFSRLATDASVHRLQSLNEVLTTVRESLEERIVAENVTLEISENLPSVSGDRNQLEMLFSELILNAIRFRGSASPKINITAAEQDEHWRIDVSDNGMGIDKFQQDAIFQIFRRLHPERDSEGTGIGLTLCSRIVGNHRGILWLNSKPGIGTTFSIGLPKLADTIR